MSEKCIILDVACGNAMNGCDSCSIPIPSSDTSIISRPLLCNRTEVSRRCRGSEKIESELQLEFEILETRTHHTPDGWVQMSSRSIRTINGLTVSINGIVNQLLHTAGQIVNGLSGHNALDGILGNHSYRVGVHR